MRLQQLQQLSYRQQQTEQQIGQQQGEMQEMRQLIAESAERLMTQLNVSQLAHGERTKQFVQEQQLQNTQLQTRQQNATQQLQQLSYRQQQTEQQVGQQQGEMQEMKQLIEGLRRDVDALKPRKLITYLFCHLLLRLV